MWRWMLCKQINLARCLSVGWVWTQSSQNMLSKRFSLIFLICRMPRLSWFNQRWLAWYPGCAQARSECQTLRMRSYQLLHHDYERLFPRTTLAVQTYEANRALSNRTHQCQQNAVQLMPFACPWLTEWTWLYNTMLNCSIAFCRVSIDGIDTLQKSHTRLNSAFAKIKLLSWYLYLHYDCSFLYPIHA